MGVLSGKRRQRQRERQRAHSATERFEGNNTGKNLGEGLKNEQR